MSHTKPNKMKTMESMQKKNPVQISIENSLRHMNLQCHSVFQEEPEVNIKFTKIPYTIMYINKSVNYCVFGLLKNVS